MYVFFLLFHVRFENFVDALWLLKFYWLPLTLWNSGDALQILKISSLPSTYALDFFVFFFLFWSTSWIFSVSLFSCFPSSSPYFLFRVLKFLLLILRSLFRLLLFLLSLCLLLLLLFIDACHSPIVLLNELPSSYPWGYNMDSCLLHL